MTTAKRQPTEPALLALAQKNFGALSPAEEELFRAAQEGRVASVLTGDEKKDDPANAANWPAERVVRAECISWLCTDRLASTLVAHRGLQLYGMRIAGELDLSSIEIRFPLLAWKCAFSKNVYLRDAQLRGFYLLDCQIKSLNANRAIFSGSVFLRDGFKAEDEVNLVATKIGGVLDCSGAQFANANGLALNASMAKIDGSVFLHDGFKAEGEVNLVQAVIGGGLACNGAQFSNSKGLALAAHAAKIESSVVLQDSKVEGVVRLVGITIGGSLECDGAQFANANGFALNANGAKIEGSVFLRKGFKAEGEINLAGAAIGGDLDWSDSQFLNAKGLALDANMAKIDGSVFLRDGFKAEGEVSFLGAAIGGLQIRDVIEPTKLILDLRLTRVGAFWDDEKSWPKVGNLLLDGFHYERLYEEAPFQAESRKKWLSLQPQDRFRPQPYEQLAAVLRQMGHERDARRIMISKNRERARFTPLFRQGWWWYNFFGRLIGYGYAPWRAFAMSVGMIVLGTVLFHFGSEHDLISPTSENAYVKEPNEQLIREENEPPKISEKYPVFNSFFYSLESFTPLLKLDQSANWRPNANHGAPISICGLKLTSTGSLLRYYLYLHIAAGWLLTSLWIGAVTGLVKT